MSCTVCDKPVEAKGLCKRHYQQQRRAALRDDTWQPEPKAKPKQPPPPEPPRRSGDGYTIDQLSMPLARPITAAERDAVTQLLTNHNATDLTDMLLGATP
jgi:hypothetical protein